MLDFVAERRSTIFACVCIGSMIATGPFAAAQPAAPPNPSVPTLTVTTREVLLDVVVADAHGQPVAGLTAADFHLTEDGTPQAILHVDEHLPMSQADVARLEAAPPIPPNTFTNYTPIANTDASTVVLIDALDTPVDAQMFLRDELISYLKSMKPGPSIAIFQLDTEMHLIQGFSSDPKVLLAAAESKRIQSSRSNSYVSKATRLDMLRAAMKTMGGYLAGFPGRKNLIWLTGDVPLTIFGEYAGRLLRGVPGPFGSDTSIGDPFRDDFSVSQDGALGFADELTLSRVAVYPVDARGLQADPGFSASQSRAPSGGETMAFTQKQLNNQTKLDQVAESTGGKAYYNTNGIKQAIAQVVNDGSNYYTLSYSSSNADWHGQFRDIKLAVDRPGVKLEYRPGYYATNRDAQEQKQIAALKRRKDNQGEFHPQAESTSEANPEQGALMKTGPGGFAAAMELGAVPPTEIVFLAGLKPDDRIERIAKDAPQPQWNYLQPQWRDKPYRNYQIHVHGEASRIGFVREADGERHGEIEFVAVVYTPGGETVNSIEKTIHFNLKDDEYRRFIQFGFGLDLPIAIPVKGEYFLRVAHTRHHRKACRCVGDSGRSRSSRA